MAVTEELRIVITGENKVGGALKSVGGALGNIGKVALGVAAGGIAAVGAGIGLVASKAIPAASDLNEALNAVSVVFGENASQIEEWGKTAADVAGLSQADFAQMAAQTGAMLQNFGLSASDAADETINLAQRAADMASIFNTDVDEALMAIQAGLRGEADPLERFGVAMSAAAVKAKAMELGLADANGELDNAAMTQARLALLMEQTDKIAGDFVNTSDQLANASRVNKARWENFMASLGQKFLPIIEKFQGIFMDLAQKAMPIVEKALENVMPHIERFANFLAELIGVVAEMGIGSSEVGEVLASMFGPQIAETITGIIERVTSLFEIIRLLVTGDFRGGIFGMSEDDPFITFLLAARESVMTFISIAIPQLIAGFQQLQVWIQQIAEVVFPLLATAVQFVTDNWNIFKPIIAAVGIAILALSSPITLIVGAIVLLATAWANNWGGIQEKTKKVTDFIKGIVTNFLNALQEFWDKHGEEITAIVQALWDGVIAIWEWFKEYFNTLWEAFRAAFEGDWETFGEKIRDAWDMVWELVVEALELAWETIKTVVEDGIEAIITWFNETDWKQVGDDVIQGIANGIDAGVKWVIDAARRAAKAAWDAITGFFKADSPSRLMMDFGEDLMKGWAIGINNLAGLPATATMSAGAGIVNSASTINNVTRSDNIFVQNSASAAFLAQRAQEIEFEDIDRLI